MVLFLFNGVVFVLLGLQLQDVIAGISGYTWGELAFDALIVCVTVVGVRMIWIFPGSRISLWLNRLHYPNLSAPRARDVFIAGWAGIRGAVTLAAALSLPLMAGTAAFPERDLLIFLATSVIVFTLTVNGLSLPLLIRFLRVSDDGAMEQEERDARVAIAHAAIELLRGQLQYQDDVADREFTQALIGEYQRRIEHADETLGSDSGAVTRMAAERAMRLYALGVERARLRELRDAHKINEHIMFAIQRELDFREASLAVATPRRAETAHSAGTH